MPTILPKSGKRQSSKSRIDVSRTNQNRITIKSEKLTISRTNGVQSSKLRDKAEGYEDASECLADNVVLLPAGRQTASVECMPHNLRNLKHVAKRHNVKLTEKSPETRASDFLTIGQTAKEAYGQLILDCSGTADDLREFANHVAGHSGLPDIVVQVVTLAMESTQTDAHVSDAIRNGHTLPPKRIDYSAGRGQPKASYPINGHYSANDIDHCDTRNDNKRAGMFAPQIADTEH